MSTTSDFKYVNSDNINIFPSTRRVHSQDFSARLMTESAIARIINTLIDTEGFVISDTLNNTSFEFNIYGYYFQITNIVNFLTAYYSQQTDVYASIFINETNEAFSELYVPAETTTFQGVAFTTDGEIDTAAIPTDCFVKTLKIATKQNSSWVVPDASKIKFNTKAVGLEVIDGGVVTAAG